MLKLEDLRKMVHEDNLYLYEALKKPCTDETDKLCSLSGYCDKCPSLQKWDKQFEEGQYASMIYVNVYIKRVGEDRCAITIAYSGRKVTKEFPIPECLEAFKIILELGVQAGREVSAELDDFGYEIKWGNEVPPVDWSFLEHFGWEGDVLDTRFVEFQEV